VLEEPGAQSGALRAFDMFLRWLGRFSGLKRASFALGAMLAKAICAACPKDQPDTGRRLCWNGSGTGNIDVAMPMQGKTQDSVSSAVVLRRILQNMRKESRGNCICNIPQAQTRGLAVPPPVPARVSATTECSAQFHITFQTLQKSKPNKLRGSENLFLSNLRMSLYYICT
jgi:hypothetical protein